MTRLIASTLVFLWCVQYCLCLPTSVRTDGQILYVPRTDAVPSSNDGLLDIVKGYVRQYEGFNDKQIVMQHEIDTLKREVKELKELVLRKTDSGEGRGIDVNLRSRRETNNFMRRRRRRRAPEVAFQASLMKRSDSYQINEPIKFDKVITNSGHAYNKQSGVFTAPRSGTYFFSATILADKGHYLEANIRVNDQHTFLTAVSDHRTTDNKNTLDISDQGNVVAVLKLNKNDKVSVVIHWPYGNHEVYGVGKSSFGGYLLRPA